MISQQTKDKIHQAACVYAEDFMQQVDEVEREQAKWQRRHPEEPYVPGGIKACFLFMRDAFAAGAEWAVTYNKNESNQPCSRCMACGEHSEKCEVYPDCGD
ncbi:MAG: hypothetical protein IJV24_07365 [Prevotella sp.]|nr:hypothetical protein [Prevotella sp.]